jgi:hypothetical protein
VAAVLARTNRWRYDWQFIAGLYRQDLAAGLGWAGRIGEAGFKGEGAYFRSRERFAGDRGDWSVSATLDYSFPGAWYVSAAGLYLSRPAVVPAVVSEGVSPLARPALSPKSLMPYRYTLYASAAKTFSPLVTAQLALAYGTDERALIVFPAVAWSAAADLTLDLTAQSFFSDGPGGFRTRGNTVISRLRWNF